MATKTELLTALQTRYPKQDGETNADYITRVSAMIQPGIDRSRERLQAQLDKVPATAKEYLKQEALEILADEAENQYLEDNKTSSL
jgi:hypothetical protein